MTRVLPLLFLLAPLLACSSAPTPRAAGAVTSVVATTSVVADLTRAVGGGDVEVTQVIRPNVDPHDFEPSPADIDAIAHADVVVENGVGLEAWFAGAVASAEPHGAIVDASTGVSIRIGEGDGRDPHIWLDPRNAKAMASTIAAALERADPSHGAGYRSRLAAYATELDALDAEIAAQISALPDKHLVTNHDAFGYYVARYGLVFVGSIIPSLDTSAQLSVAETTALVERIRATGTKAVFAESSLPPRTAEAIANEAGVRVVAGPDALYGDSLGPPGSDGDTYLKMMRHDTKVIVDNLR